MIRRQSPVMRTHTPRGRSVAARGWPVARARTPRLITVALAALLLVVGAALPASADGSDADGPAPAPASAPREGVIFTQVPAGVLSLSDCRAGYFCIWSQPDFTGNLWQYGSGSTRYTLTSSPYYSYWNNRPRTSELSSSYSGVTGSYRCLPPGARSDSLSGWTVNAHSVYLASFQTVC